MEKAHALVIVRDINLVCQHYKTYARLKAELQDGRSREPAGQMASWKFRTVARDEWVQPVAWIEWVNDLGVLIRYMAQDVR
jgi:hypothetical protein